MRAVLATLFRSRSAKSGRPEDLPHTATIKQTTDVEALVVAFMMLGYTRIVRAAKPYRRSTPATGRTISADLIPRDGPVEHRTPVGAGQPGSHIDLRCLVDQRMISGFSDAAYTN